MREKPLPAKGDSTRERGNLQIRKGCPKVQGFPQKGGTGQKLDRTRAQGAEQGDAWNCMVSISPAALHWCPCLAGDH